MTQIRELWIGLLFVHTVTLNWQVMAIDLLGIQVTGPTPTNLISLDSNLLSNLGQLLPSKLSTELINKPENLQKIDADLINKLHSSSSEMLLEFGGTAPVLNSIRNAQFESMEQRRGAIIQNLQTFSSQRQSIARNVLNLFNVVFKSFWIANYIVVQEGTLEIAGVLSMISDVTRIRSTPVNTLSPIVSPNNELNQAEDVPWGIRKIQADRCWNEQNVTGKGVCVATIDSGVRGSHEALRENFRGTHAWLDPYDGSPQPIDVNGHGTHTMGSIAGTNGIGVAPGATWIACRGCGNSSCGSEQLLTCAEFIMAPTNPQGNEANPDLCPDLVSNSWGSLIGMDEWYTSCVDAWTAAGIFSVFAIGNQGPFCFSGGSPGDRPTIFSVGSTDINDALSFFSSRGPTLPFELNTKPDICGPGEDVRSSWNTGDSKYETISGTSMATPHVAGVAALVLSALGTKETRMSLTKSNPSSFITAITNILTFTTDTETLSSGVIQCDIFQEDPTKNNEFGFGRVNAFKSVENVIKTVK